MEYLTMLDVITVVLILAGFGGVLWVAIEEELEKDHGPLDAPADAPWRVPHHHGGEGNREDE